MTRSALAAVLLLVGCNMEHETPVPPPPPPPPSSTSTAPAPAPSAPAPSAAPAPAPSAAPAPAPAPSAAPAPTPSAAPAPPHTAAAPAASSLCQSAFHCCQAAIAAMPIGGLVAGCGELRDADESRADYCREAIQTYRATLTQIGAPIPAACHAPH